MSRLFILELPYNYTIYLSQRELIFWILVTCVIFALIIKSFFVKVQGGREGLIGQNVAALNDFSREDDIYIGQVLCMGEIWTAKADFPIKKGTRLFVSSSEKLVLFLSKHDSVNNDDTSE